MFRASDYEPPVLHESYARKPMPSLQLHSQISKFDGESTPNSSRVQATTYDTVPRPVPATYDTFYDPNHPKADWSGLVSVKDAERKHENSHRSQQMNLIQTEKGITGANERCDIPRKRKDSGTQPVGDSGGNIIGGIGCGEDQWKTTYSGLANNEKTSRSQLTLPNRTAPRKQLDPYATRGDSFNNNQNYNNNVNRAPSNEFYRPNASNANRSLISNLGASIMKDRVNR